ncbi:anthrone oxygenase family protein [Qipengyuania flava]|uniref:anthrone oxygenase family protein n=1 Tax=Qipengyuania flava TaxID=192812 RepID=UPI001C55E670|nr:anthrone oxygenase family protein [Qipengyuania flava]MBW3169318.1 DUF1772 domain-containing protein [Qipengyuania flava]MBY5966556.1 DUF1772 domain-containing protein [Qipengyuania flava]MBY6012880.1 DUF1772 domain-containing protein [Qipengyuania flava]MBY6027322.1 DUF1772 domain-containing protein [Qipengyuania flava]
MSRIPTPEIDNAPEASKALLEGVKKQLGSVPNMFRLIANSPEVLNGQLAFSAALNGGKLNAATRERIALAVAESVLTALASGIYWPSVFLVTVFGNVPMNKRLDGLAPGSAEARKYWAIYARRWTLLNHWRTVGCLATSIAYALAALSFP